MQFVMNEAVSKSSPAAKGPAVRSNDTSCSSAPTSTRPVQKRPSKNKGQFFSSTPPLMESPPTSSGRFHSTEDDTSIHSIQRDVEASEASDGFLEDDSLQDFFAEDELHSPSAGGLHSSLHIHAPARGTMGAGAAGLHSSMSALQSSGLHGSLSALQQSARSSFRLHRQGSLSSLPLTMEESNRMRKRGSKVLNWTGAANNTSSSSLRTTPTPKRPPTTTSTDALYTSRKPNTVQTVKRRPGLHKILLIGLGGCSLLATFTALMYCHWRGWFPITAGARREAKHKPYLEILLKEEGIDTEPLFDPTTDAYKALDWMANDDIPQQDAQWVQRWSLATLYLATHSSSAATKWHNETNWMTRAPTCDWYGVECEILGGSDWFDITMGGKGDSSNNDAEKQPSLHVVRLHLPGNHVHGTLPHEIRHLSHLMSLDLSNNHLSGTLPQGPTLGHYLRLTHLRLDRNRFTGELPPALGYNLILKQLQLDCNQFRGTIPAVWGNNLRNLREWSMAANFLTGSIPTTLGGLKHLEVLEWNDNQLTGHFPFSLCAVTTLKTVKLQFNSLGGSIPSEFIMSAQALEVLDLGHNQLTGSLPDVMATSNAAQNLKHFHTQHNQLTGRLPKTLGHLTQLTSLRFDDNHFTGWIPVAWQHLDDLQILRLENNKLGGSLPSQLSRLTQLEEFQFQNNLLHPTLPKKILRNLPKLQYHSVGFYVSEDREKQLDADLADEQSRMRRQQEMRKDERPSFISEHLPKAETDKKQGSQHYEPSILTLANTLQDLHEDVPTVEHHFEDEEM